MSLGEGRIEGRNCEVVERLGLGSTTGPVGVNIGKAVAKGKLQGQPWIVVTLSNKEGAFNESE